MKKKYSLKTRIAAFSIIGFIFLSLFLLIMEVVFRNNDKYGRAGFSFDKNLIWRQKRNLTGQKPYGQGQVGKDPFVLRFNNEGFRGADFSKEKPEGTTRVMVLGDSYTAGLDYPDDKIFTGLLENELNEEGLGKFEVLNVASPAWGTDQHYIYWFTEGIEYQPDYLLMMIAPNDMREMYNKGLVKLVEGEVETIQPYYSKKAKIGWYLANRSSFFQYLQQKVLKTSYGDFLKIFHTFPVNYGVKDSADWDAPIYLKETFPEIEETYELFEVMINDLAESCSQQGTKLLIAKIPIKAEFDGTYETEEHDPQKITGMLDSIAHKNDIPFLNLNERLVKKDNPLEIFMHWEYHFNETGHAFTAGQLETFIKENLN